MDVKHETIVNRSNMYIKMNQLYKEIDFSIKHFTLFNSIYINKLTFTKN